MADVSNQHKDMDYEPLPGDMPSRELALYVRRFHMKPPTIIVQDIEQIPAGSPITDDPFEFAPAEIIGAPSAGQYGPDFTEDGMCNWATYKRRMQLDMPIGEIKTAAGGVGRLAFIDGTMAFADHRHRCRPCRQRMNEIIGDLEGEFRAIDRYASSQATDENVDAGRRR